MSTRLIAAAPELLEALRIEHLVEEYDGGIHEYCSVCDLIDKAMGRA